VGGVGELVRVDDAGPADAPALRGGGSAGAAGTFEAVGALHLSEQREQDDDQLRHRVGGAEGVHLDGVGEVADPDAVGGEVMDQVQGVAHGPSEPVEGVNHDDIVT
jgi:hypothetical protein